MAYSRSLSTNHIGAILAAVTKRLQVVHCAARALMGHQVFVKLLQHASTLKEFSVIMALDVSSILRFLKSFPNLSKLTDLDKEGYWATLIPEAGAAD